MRAILPNKRRVLVVTMCEFGGTPSWRKFSCSRFFFQAEDGIRVVAVTGVQTCALPISRPAAALADVRKVADDFIILRTLPGGLAELVDRLDWTALLERFDLAFLSAGKARLDRKSVV